MAEGSSSFGGVSFVPVPVRNVKSNQASKTAEFGSGVISDDSAGAAGSGTLKRVLGGEIIVGTAALALAINSVWLTQSRGCSRGAEHASEGSPAAGEDVTDVELADT